MMITEAIDMRAVNTRFQEIWDANNMFVPDNPLIASAMEQTTFNMEYPETAVHTVGITDVTLRDGQQQRTNEVSVEERVAVFDNIVRTGVDRIEIGHLGNANGDQQLATAIVEHIAQKESEGADEYGDVKLQVLFGSQEDKIQEGIGVLESAFKNSYGENWRKVMADKVVVHVYDRLSEGLRNTAAKPYSDEQSAERIVVAAQHAIDAGFTQFSVSGEGETAETPERAIQFHRSINDALFERGAERVNVNLANTFGYSANETWNTDTLSIFNQAVKAGYDGSVTTSIHTHNDFNSAADFSVMSVIAGFDRVEGAHIGMGERPGNVATMDFIARILEQAMHGEIQEDKPEKERTSIASYRAGRMAIRGVVRLDARIARQLSAWYDAGQNIANIFGPYAAYRFERTIVGGPQNLDNGSGPHDQAMVANVEDPINKPIWQTYEGALVVDGIMGRPAAEDIAVGDLAAVREITVGNHAGGGKTSRLKTGEGLEPALPDQIEIAREHFRAFSQKVIDRAVNGVTLQAA